ncbi:uncharacterized protein LOC142238165 [Haematobia irritans]|uniref:uncharacterized protein LOC142238165 n=1 Tax=Haematobia irritans TaxID=7368 RepID=UPI003F504E79
MAFRTISAVCRVGHLLAKPGRLIENSLKTSSPVFECKRCQIRFQSRDDCKQKPKEKCGERFKNAPCDPNYKSKTHIIKQAMPKPLPDKDREIKMKIPDICCGKICPDALPRFDKLYYRRSDKAKREYQQTWAECPELLVKPKVICSFENIKYPILEKRPKQKRPQTACKPPTCDDSEKKCPNFVLPQCGQARRPPNCRIKREPLDCVKRKTPYPSFSECKKAIPQPLHPIECKCLALPTMCEIWEHYNRQMTLKANFKC